MVSSAGQILMGNCSGQPRKYSAYFTSEETLIYSSKWAIHSNVVIRKRISGIPAAPGVEFKKLIENTSTGQILILDYLMRPLYMSYKVRDTVLWHDDPNTIIYYIERNESLLNLLKDCEFFDNKLFWV